MLKFLKLINDERKQTVLKNAKACTIDQAQYYRNLICFSASVDIL